MIFPLYPGNRPGTEDSNYILASFRKTNQQKTVAGGMPYDDFATFTIRMCRVIKDHTVGICKH
jgi:hypothetical protein